MGTIKKILIIHGWTYSLEKWSSLTNALKKDGFEVEFAKVPGLTEESKNVWNIKKYVSWLSNIVDKYNSKVILVGHSNGGRIAISYAAKFPNKIEHLILIDSAGILHNGFPIRLKRLVFKTVAKVGKKFVNGGLFRKILYKLASEKDYEKASENMGRTMVNLISVDLKPKLKEIKVPTLIIWGKEDKITPLDDAYVMKNQIKGSILEIIDKTSHSPFYLNPERVAQIIKNAI